MIKSIEAKFFRKHIDLKIDFVSGLNVLRGANEAGKTTVTEIILYCLFGSTSLVDKLEEVVTWGHKESELEAKLVLVIGEVEYVFTRSKSGAECSFSIKLVNGDLFKKLITGQKEVTAHAAYLLGADAKTASVLMLASQAGLRGALDNGPAAVGTLMGKLADFDTIDRLLHTAQATLSLGSIVPLQTRLATADADLANAQARQVDPQTLADAKAAIEAHEAVYAAEQAKVQELLTASEKALDAYDKASDVNAAHAYAQRKVIEMRVALQSAQADLEQAQRTANSKPNNDALQIAEYAVRAAKDHALIVVAYSAYQRLPAYPAVFWDKEKESFDAEYDQAIKQFNVAANDVNKIDVEINALGKQLIPNNGVCPTCGNVGRDHNDILQRNTQIEKEIKQRREQRISFVDFMTKKQDEIDQLASIRLIAIKRQPHLDKCLGYIRLDDSVYPVKAVWGIEIPETEVHLERRQHALSQLKDQERKAIHAEGLAAAHTVTVTRCQTALQAAADDLASKIKVDLVPLKEASDAAYLAYSNQSERVSAISCSISQAVNNYKAMVQTAEHIKQQVDMCQRQITNLQNDIKDTEFNNELVRKLKSMKPKITDYLWNNVLAAVGNYFSNLRGEQSIVTKDAAGFRVNGRAGSLSGSTLDMLALAIRVALSKTFVPHVSFMILDEPAHGCDRVRAGSLLGFLSGAGFQQVVLASHDELSESVADNVIMLEGA